MFKRIFLFVLTNILVIATISIVTSLLGVNQYMTAQGLNYQQLFLFALVVGFTGSFISLFLSKWMAKMSYGIRLIETPQSTQETMIVQTIKDLAFQLQMQNPEIGIYDSAEPNAFATGWGKNHSLVAVSTGLLNSMTEEEVRGVLGHEMAHIANGDMVTMTLLQGIINTFVIFFARIAAYFATQFLSKNDDGEPSPWVYPLITFVFEMVLSVLGSLIVFWFSRRREYRADALSARLLGKDPMIHALRRLKSLSEGVQETKDSFATMKISGGGSSIFSTHPALEDRIAALESGAYTRI